MEIAPKGLYDLIFMDIPMPVMNGYKGILGDSYLVYFRRKRMEKAAELLESTNLKVIEIANAVGYENQGKFAKVFAEWSGVSPLEFRRLSK